MRKVIEYDTNTLCSRWQLLLFDTCDICTAAKVSQALAAEGLHPDDEASLRELNSDVLDSLGIKDEAVRYCLLAWVSRFERDVARESVAQHVSTDQKHVVECSSMYPPLNGWPGSMLADTFGRFQRRCFESSDRRGCTAQEVVPGVFLGGMAAARDKASQSRHGVTHILNATAHKMDSAGCKVMTLGLRDGDGEQDISKHFRSCCSFIEEAHANGGSVLVHCIRGVSRSATLVAAYVLSHARLAIEEIILLLKEARPVANPRPGFIKQLRRFEQELRHEKSNQREALDAPPLSRKEARQRLEQYLLHENSNQCQTKDAPSLAKKDATRQRRQPKGVA